MTIVDRDGEVRILEDRAQDYWLIRMLDLDTGLGNDLDAEGKNARGLHAE